MLQQLSGFIPSLWNGRNAGLIVASKPRVENRRHKETRTMSRSHTALSVIRDELTKVVEKGITPGELDRAKGSMRGGLALALEDANSRMVRLGRDELAGMPHLSVDERIAKIDGVDLDQVKDIAATTYGASTRVMGAVGPFEVDELDDYLKV